MSETASIAEQARSVIAHVFEVDPAKVVDTARFHQDLGMDSLDRVEATMAIEEHFDLEIDDQDADTLATFGDLVKWLTSHTD